MKRRAVALSLLWLWFLSPAVARAEGRAFDFSGGPSRSARLMQRSPTPVRGWMGAGRLRSLTSASVTVTTTEEEIPTHLWLVPLVLTGAGFFTGVAVCAVDSSSSSGGDLCGKALLAGTILGASLGLGYLRLVECSQEGADCSAPCDDDTEVCEEDATLKGSRQRAALKDARRKSQQGMPRGLHGLPLGLSPTVGFVNDRAVVGLGGHF